MRFADNETVISMNQERKSTDEMKNAGDIEHVISKHKEKAASRHQTVQPFILLQGKLQDFSALYIVIEDKKYQLQIITDHFCREFSLQHLTRGRPRRAFFLLIYFDHVVDHY
ncbi:hypothetical protein ACJJTC_001490 [Scirpophaga incertulas]